LLKYSPVDHSSGRRSVVVEEADAAVAPSACGVNEADDTPPDDTPPDAAPGVCFGRFATGAIEEVDEDCV
jgi:hypothetical protein